MQSQSDPLPVNLRVNMKQTLRFLLPPLAVFVFFVSTSLFERHSFYGYNTLPIFKKGRDQTIQMKASSVSTHGDVFQKYLRKRLGGSKQMFNNAEKCFDVTLCGNRQYYKSCRPKRQEANRFECKHFMTFQRHNGRAGNQMFQVSTLFGTAMYHGYTPLINSSFPLNKWFDFPNVIDIDITNANKFTRTSLRNYDRGITNLSHAYNWTLQGYMHSWRYFKGFEVAIRNVFKFKESLVTQVNDFLHETLPRNITTVCVHVRRGDYLDEFHQERGYAVAPIRYLHDAMHQYRKRFSLVHFFVVSNDKTWCQKNLKGDNVTISPFDSAGLDMTLMSVCNHTIFTSGTFGWWGAWLAGGDAIYWTGYPRKGSILDKKTNKYDLYPKQWVGLA